MSVPTDREGLRKTLIDGIDQLERHRMLLSHDQMRLLDAQRLLWSQDDGTALDQLCNVLKRMP